MALISSNGFAEALKSFIHDIKNDEDPRSTFYKEVLSHVDSASTSRASAEQSAEQLAQFVKEMDSRHRSSSHTRRIADRLGPFLTGLSQYIAACDVMIQAGPDVASLIYGGARVVLMLAEKFRKCYEDVISMMEKVGDRIKCYNIFSRAYEKSADMQWVLVESFKTIVSFWKKAAELFSKKGFKTLLSSIMKPLDAEWQKCRQDLDDDERRVRIFAQATEADMRRQREEKEAVKEAVNQQVKLRNEIVDWIKACSEEEKLDFRHDISNNLEIRHADTCEWVFKQADMVNWLASKKSTSIWYNAPPGAGKTITASAVVRHLQDKGFRTATFFCSFNDLVRRKAMAVFRSLALQLLTPGDSIPEKVKCLYEDDLMHHRSKLQNLKPLVEVVEALLKPQSRIHIIVDGLDECEGAERPQLLSSFCHLLHSKKLGIVKFFFASRPDSDIRIMMLRHGVVEYQAPQPNLKHDIRAYVTSRFKSVCGDFDDEIALDQLTEASEGNFLWVKLVMDILVDGEGTTCDDEVLEELKRFPKGLTGCYTRSLMNLARYNDRLRQLARLIFVMVIGAAQPLRLSELIHALAATKGAEDFTRGSLPRAKDIEELCSNLVIFDRRSKGTEDDPLLKAAHKSIQDFFLLDPETLELPSSDLKQYFVTHSNANREIGMAALSYLSYARYNQVRDVTTILSHEDHSFLRHAATYWYRYLDEANPNQELVQKVVDFIRSEAFWTCVAVQSFVAPLLFSRYIREFGGYIPVLHRSTQTKYKDSRSADDEMFAIALPEWLEDESYGLNGVRIVRAFHEFVTEWHPVLSFHPSAGNQCVMGPVFEKELPGRVAWSLKRADLFVLAHDNKTSLIDTYQDATTLKAFILQCNTDYGRYSATWKQPISAVEWHPTDAPASYGQHFLAPLSARSYIFVPYRSLNDDHWIVDTKRLVAQYYVTSDVDSEPAAPDSYLPDQVHEEWSLLCTSTGSTCSASSTSHRWAAFNCIRTQSAKNDAQSQESGYGSMDSSDTDSDSDSDDESSDDGIKTTRFSMLVLGESGKPHWLFWKSKVDMEAHTAFHPTERLAVLSKSAHDLSIMDLDSGSIQSTILPEPLDVCFSAISAMRKEFHFSHTDAGTTLYYLLYTATETETGMKHTFSLSSFLFCSTNDPECALERTCPTETVVYESTGSVQHPFILTYWGPDYLYASLPPLSCNPKIIRMLLPTAAHNAVSQANTVETLRDPIYFPYSTPHRTPRLKMFARKPGKDRLVLSLNAECASETGAGAVTGTVVKPPAIMAWNLRSTKDWRSWAEELDAKDKSVQDNECAYALLRGSFADKDRRFGVPVRSGLDWRRKAFLSCA